MKFCYVINTKTIPLKPNPATRCPPKSYRWIPRYCSGLLLGCCLLSPAAAETQGGGDWWHSSKQAAGEMWDKTARRVSEFWRSEGGDAVLAQIWDRLVPRLNRLSLLQEEHEQLPASAWFGRDQGDAEQDMNALLDEAVEILSLSGGNPVRAQIQSLEEQIRQHKETIAEYRQAQVGAPVKSPWQTTVADYEQKVAQINREIAAKQSQIETLKEAFKTELEGLGLRLDRDQLELLLSSVVGDKIIQNSVVYANVKQISEQLMRLSQESGEEVAISRRYYGMYTVLLKTLLHMQDRFVAQIDQTYLPRIDLIVTQVNEVNARTLSLLRDQQETQRQAHLQANLAAQELTLRTAEVYRRHLLDQRQKMLSARDKTSADFQVAQNTYRTVTVSGELVNLLRASQQSFDLLLNIQVPELLVFENLQMKQEFAILTARLAQ